MAALEAIVPSFVPADERMVQLLLTSLWLVGALLVAAAIIALVKRWRRQRDVKEDVSPNAELAHYRSLYEAGTISQEEFERLRAVLSARMRESLGVNPPSPAGGPDTPPAASAPPESGMQRPEGPNAGIGPA